MRGPLHKQSRARKGGLVGLALARGSSTCTLHATHSILLLGMAWPGWRLLCCAGWWASRGRAQPAPGRQAPAHRAKAGAAHIARSRAHARGKRAILEPSVYVASGPGGKRGRAVRAE